MELEVGDVELGELALDAAGELLDHVRMRRPAAAVTFRDHVRVQITDLPRRNVLEGHSEKRGRERRGGEGRRRGETQEKKEMKKKEK